MYVHVYVRARVRAALIIIIILFVACTCLDRSYVSYSRYIAIAGSSIHVLIYILVT
jgi:hypothetical protein